MQQKDCARRSQSARATLQSRAAPLRVCPIFQRSPGWHAASAPIFSNVENPHALYLARFHSERLAS